jgi:hypothetical protein
MRAIFAVDGGNASGLAWGVFDDRCGSVTEALASRRNFGSTTLNRKITRNRKRVYESEFTPDHIQVETIYTQFTRFKRECHNDKIPLDDIDLVLEDFILLPGTHAGGKDGVSSVRITWGIVGYQMGVSNEFSRRHRHYHITPITWQSPSQKGRVTDDYLRKNGIWVPGRDHENDAWRHIVVRLGTVMS